MTTETEQSPRDAIRAALVGNTPPGETRDIEIFGIKLLLRQPTLEAVMAVQDVDKSSERAAMMIINFCCVPGTEELAFEVGDLPQILKWPFGADATELNSAIAEMSGIDIDAAEEELKNPLSAPS